MSCAMCSLPFGILQVWVVLLCFWMQCCSCRILLWTLMPNPHVPLVYLTAFYFRILQVWLRLSCFRAFGCCCRLGAECLELAHLFIHLLPMSRKQNSFNANTVLLLIPFSHAYICLQMCPSQEAIFGETTKSLIFQSFVLPRRGFAKARLCSAGRWGELIPGADPRSAEQELESTGLQSQDIMGIDIETLQVRDSRDGGSFWGRIARLCLASPFVSYLGRSLQSMIWT